MKLRRLWSVVLAIVLGATPVMAAPFDPTGRWEASDGESRYDVALCGDGSQLCVKLIWIKPDKINKRNKQYLQTMVVDGAKRASDVQWRGTITIYGVAVQGSVTAVSKDVMQVRGCALIVFCDGRKVFRIK